ncbi:hypothetical protein [Leucobacter coleopterorum]|uniref:hypothetical protein n=1 Tax=Leucobacter coleopterorum TaxID=2714933 RepID=UPI001FCB56F6|nr:hypothetical protein [Leucobacter coleopterorum]
MAAAGDEVIDGRLRRYYELTEAGASNLAEAANRSAQIAAEAKARLQKSHPGLAGAAWGGAA